VREKAVQEVRQGLVLSAGDAIKWLVCRGVLTYSRRYMILREDQRFYWQKALSPAERSGRPDGPVVCCAGRLKRAEDIFFATVEEIEGAMAGKDLPAREIERRKVEFGRLLEQYEKEPGLSYPDFLRGNEPLLHQMMAATGFLRGVPVSPGIARGPARLITSPASSNASGQAISSSPGRRILAGRLFLLASPGWCWNQADSCRTAPSWPGSTACRLWPASGTP